MAQVKRNDIEQVGEPLPGYVADGYEAGGPVAQLQADLALRLAGEGIGWVPTISPLPAERWVRLASTAGGYAALLAGYLIAALVIVRWV